MLTCVLGVILVFNIIWCVLSVILTESDFNH